MFQSTFFSQIVLCNSTQWRLNLICRPNKMICWEIDKTFMGRKITIGVNFTKLCWPSKKLPAHSFWQKYHSISPRFCLKLCWWNFPNLWDEIRKINVPFAESVCSLLNTICQKKLIILFSKKSLAKMLVKSTPGSLLQLNSVITIKQGYNKITAITNIIVDTFFKMTGLLQKSSQL